MPQSVADAAAERPFTTGPTPAWLAEMTADAVPRGRRCGIQLRSTRCACAGSRTRRYRRRRPVLVAHDEDAAAQEISVQFPDGRP